MTQRERQILQMIESNPMISQQEMADALGITRSSAAVHISNLMKKGLILGKGYVLSSGAYAAIIGGVNVDIGGHADSPLIRATSTPGHVSVTLGGVGRNIAHNLCLMGVDVRMLTAYGDDVHGNRVAASCSELGIDISHALKVPGAATSTYVYLTDVSGRTVLAVSDMEICKKITPQYLSNNLSLLQNARVVVADTNLPEESLIFLAENCNVPLFFDPVSPAKAEKLKPILNRIHTLKPSRKEAELLSGVEIHNQEDAALAAQKLLELGVGRVFITMGVDGIYAATKEQQLWLPSQDTEVVSISGCGDAMMSALVWAYLEDLDLKETMEAGVWASTITAESDSIVNPAMSATAIRTRMAALEQ